MNKRASHLHLNALDFALNKKQFDIAEDLMEIGARFDGSDPRLLHKVAGAGRIGLMRKILETGASDNAEISGTGVFETALHSAALNGQTEAARLLLDHGADINARGGVAQETPLMWAAQFGKLETVEFLLQHGADATIKNKDGSTVLQLVQKRIDKSQEIPNLDKIAALLSASPESPASPASNYDTLIAELVEIGKSEKFIRANAP